MFIVIYNIQWERDSIKVKVRIKVILPLQLLGIDKSTQQKNNPQIGKKSVHPCSSCLSDQCDQEPAPNVTGFKRA